jgi:hypothetical protein
MRIRMSLSGPRLTVQLETAGRTWAKATSAAVHAATEGAKLELRKQLASRGGRMSRLRGAIRSATYPKPPRYSAKAAGTVYAAGDSADRMFTAFSTGPVVTPKGGKALAIPLHNYRGVDRQLLGPKSSFFAGRIIFIPRSNLKTGGNKVVGIYAMKATGRPGSIRKQRNTPRRKSLSAQIDGGLVPVFMLVSSAQMPKLLSPETIMAKWAGQIPDLIAQAARMLDNGR